MGPDFPTQSGVQSVQWSVVGAVSEGSELKAGCGVEVLHAPCIPGSVTERVSSLAGVEKGVCLSTLTPEDSVRVVPEGGVKSSLSTPPTTYSPLSWKGINCPPVPPMPLVLSWQQALWDRGSRLDLLAMSYPSVGGRGKASLPDVQWNGSCGSAWGFGKLRPWWQLRDSKEIAPGYILTGCWFVGRYPMWVTGGKECSRFLIQWGLVTALKQMCFCHWEGAWDSFWRNWIIWDGQNWKTCCVFLTSWLWEKVLGFARDFTCTLIFSSWCLLSLSSTRPTVGFQGFRWEVSVHCPWSVPCYLTTGWDPVMCKWSDVGPLSPSL